MKFVELFAGIGGMGYGLMKAGMECVGYCEIDKHAHKAFQILHDSKKTMWEGWDVRDVTDDDIQVLGESEDRYSYSLEDFLAKLFQLLESGKDSRTQLEALYFLKSSGSHLFSDPSIYSWKMSQDFLTTTTEEHSKPSSERWMSWGTWDSGLCLTAKTLEFRKTESECSLSDILEENPDPRYYLSEEKTQKLFMSLEK